MLRAILRRVILAATAIAFLSGATVQLLPLSVAAMPSNATATMPDCERMGVHAAMPHPPAPCKSVTLDCLKMGCIGSPTLPTRSGGVTAPAEYGRIGYPVVASWRAGISIEPDLFPPIAA
jgi:hypothetical protein